MTILIHQVSIGFEKLKLGRASSAQDVRARVVVLNDRLVDDPLEGCARGCSLKLQDTPADGPNESFDLSLAD